MKMDKITMEMSEKSEKSAKVDENKLNGKTTSHSGPADFEKAITATGFGKFNFLLYAISITSGWSSIFATTTMSYVFPAAQCDLNLTLSNKGLLNAITYVGMISSAFIWGYLCDTLGRKKLMIIGFLLDAFFVVMGALSQNFIFLLIAKFFEGFIINGPFAALTCYLSEYHCARHRARVQMVLGVIFSSGTVFLPLLAWAILPQNLYFNLGSNFEIHSWNIFLLISSLAPFISGIAFMFLPESPKFLMTAGRNDEALSIFKKVYRINTGSTEDTYPIVQLVNEIKNNGNSNHKIITENRSKLEVLQEGWSQIVPLFMPPLLGKIILVCSLQFLFMLSLNSLRLWLPQLFQAINDYQYYHDGETNDLCTMIEVFQKTKKNVTVSEECVVNLNNSEVYINSIIVSATTICGYIIVGFLINILGKKKIIVTFGLTAGLLAISVFWAQDNISIITLFSFYIALASVVVNVIIAVVVDLFPTSLRTMCVSLTMMIGRSGAMSGNLVFPFLLQAGCASPFFTVGVTISSCALLTLLLPNTDMKSLE